MTIYYPNYQYRPEYLDYLKSKNRYTLNQLGTSARNEAIRQFILVSRHSHIKSKNEWLRKRLARPLNDRINESKKYTWLINQMSAYKKWQNDERYLEAYIIENLQEFDVNGNLLYSLKEDNVPRIDEHGRIDYENSY